METIWSWWNFDKGYLIPENKFQICDHSGWKQPRFIAFSIEDAQMICDILNISQQAVEVDMQKLCSE